MATITNRATHIIVELNGIASTEAFARAGAHARLAADALLDAPRAEVALNYDQDGHPTDDDDAAAIIVTLRRAPTANPMIQDECRGMAGFHMMLVIAKRLAKSGYAVSIEYPLFLHVTAPNGEKVNIERDSHDGTWMMQEHTPENDHDYEQIDLDTDGDPDPGQIHDLILDAIEHFTERGSYATAAERRQADRDEQEARNR